MAMLPLLANVAYVLMLLAFVTADMLRLRLLLVSAQLCLLVYGIGNRLWVMPAWNLVFLGINGFMVVKILRERRELELPPDLREIHARHFTALTPREFLRFWNQGDRQTLTDSDLAHQGEQPKWLYFLLSGTVEVRRNGVLVRELPPGYFVAEMSLLTGAPANADVRTKGTVEVIRWNRDALHDLRQRSAAFWTKIQSVIGRDLVEKIHLGDLYRTGTA
jgi:hypothetical protein